MRQQQQQKQHDLQNSGGFGDELGGGIFSSIAKNTPSFGFGSPQPVSQEQRQQQQQQQQQQPYNNLYNKLCLVVVRRKVAV